MVVVSSISTAHHAIYQLRLESTELHFDNMRLVEQLPYYKRFTKADVIRHNKDVTVLLKERRK